MRRLSRILIVVSVAGSACSSVTGQVSDETTVVGGIPSSTVALEEETTSTPMPAAKDVTTVPAAEGPSPVAEGSLDPGEQQAFVFVSSTGVEVEYLLYLPEAYDNNEQWPVMVSLHGFLGFSDQTIDSVRRWNPLVWVDPTMDFPFFLISPLQPDEGPWYTLHDPLQELLDELESLFSVDRSAVFLTGLSAGAIGTWQWAIEHPDTFAGIAPIEGSASMVGNQLPQGLCSLVDLPVRAGHGEGSPQAPQAGHAAVVDALRECGSTVAQFIVYEDLNHADAIAAFYADPDLYDWMLQTASARSP